MIEMEALGDKILVKANEPERVTASGILIPTNAQEQSQQGTVISVGPECKGLKVNDTILFSKYGTTQIKIDNQEILLMRLSDVWAKVVSK